MNPYQELPDTSFWKLAVASRALEDIGPLWTPKFEVPKSAKVATYGSCFAQHIGRALAKRGHAWYNAEPAPPGMAENSAKDFNYGIFSSRTGNVYTTSLLRQWISWANGSAACPSEVYHQGDRFVDPFRPRVEPRGFASLEELVASRTHTIACFRKSIEMAKVFVFTLGLTEAWRNSLHGYEYPMCPGTVAGTFDSSRHAFVNFSFMEVMENLEASLAMMRMMNPSLKFILTVSPVPLTATCSGQHVLVATMRSKSVLRAVADHLAEQHDDVDYFPSYEIINSPVFRGDFFEANQRNVKKEGVAFVMERFFSCLEGAQTQEPISPPVSAANAAAEPTEEAASAEGREDAHCDEEFLATFAGAQKP